MANPGSDKEQTMQSCSLILPSLGQRDPSLLALGLVFTGTRFSKQEDFYLFLLG